MVDEIVLKLFFVRRIVTSWWRGIGPKVDAMVDEIVLEMVDGEEEEDMLDIVNNKLDSDTMLG